MRDWKQNLWILVACQFIVMGAMTMIIPFLPLYLQELGVTDHDRVSLWTGLIFGINFFTAFLFAPFWGRLADKHGRRLMVLRSGFGMAIVIILTGFATGPWSLFFLRLLNGTISGFIPASIALISTNTPKDQVGKALGILQSGAVAGSICGPLFGGLMAEWIGFRAIFNITGLCIAVAAFTVLFFVKEEFTPPGKSEEKTSTWKEFKTVTENHTILRLYVIVFMIQFALIGVNPLVSVFVDELTKGENAAFYAGLAVSAMGFANMLTSPKLGALGDQKGAQYVLFGALIGAVLFSVPQAFVNEIWQLISLRFLVGLCLGGLLPSANALIRKLAPVGMESRTFGFSNSFLFLGNMLGPMTGGWIVSFSGIRGLFIFSSLLLLTTVLLMKPVLRQLKSF